jgi:isoleucyl-tRNA synthetase
MAPFTPFFVEKLYQNLRHCLPDQGDMEPSIHFCKFPEAAEQAHDARVEASVNRIQTVIELGRHIRERNSRPLKTPLKRMTVAHVDGRVEIFFLFFYLKIFHQCFTLAPECIVQLPLLS